VKDVHPERVRRGGRVEGSLRPLATSHSSLATKSNHSRTSARVARKSNYSRTSAKTGGGGTSNQMCSPITLLFSSTMLTSPLSTIVGAPTFPFLHAGKVLQAHEFRCRCGLQPRMNARLKSCTYRKRCHPLRRQSDPSTPTKRTGRTNRAARPDAP